MEITGKEISEFYDTFNTGKLKKIGINIRHRTILKNLKNAGLLPSHNVLEIGCGIGTVTSLIAKYCNRGKIVAVDISPESISDAKNTWRNFSNVDFLVSDMSDFKHILKFDFVVLPDVLEHIPVGQHKNLFAKIRQHCHPDSVVLINIPNPPYLSWLHKYKPELLQIIDQPLSTNELLNNVYPNDLYLYSLNSYSLAVKEGDYQQIILKPNKSWEKITYKPKTELISQELKSRLFY